MPVKIGGHIMKNASRRQGFTLIEMLVALALVGVLGVVATGFLAPFQISRRSALESQATSYARSYLELVKGRWLNAGNFGNRNLPQTCALTSTATDCDLKLSSDWSVGVDTAAVGAWTATDTIRLVTVKATRDTYSYEFSTLISQP